MTALVQTLRTQIGFDAARPGFRGRVLNGRMLAVAALVLAAFAVPGGMDLAAHAVADAYLQVSVFVAATLVVLLGVESLFRTDMGEALARRPAWQVPAGAMLGALPGCGGAIVAVTHFTRGTLSFGSLVATLTSTMGDAMFLLLAREPATAGVVLVLGVVVGSITGYVVDAIHGSRFMQREQAEPRGAASQVWFRGLARSEWLWFALLVPGLVLGVSAAFQVEFASPLVTMVGVAGGVLAVAMWVMRGGEERPCEKGECAVAEASVPQARKLIDDTNFVTAWVVFAFVGYELFITASGVDLAQAFGVWGALAPAVAIAVGFIPGCGPQIVTTSLYLDQVIPLSALLGNAISNDGDALFPAIAKAPKAAALATLYTTVPAVVVAYGAYALGW